MIAPITFCMLAMGEHDGAQHDLFRKLLGFGFDHHHRVMGAGDDEIELAGSFTWSIARIELIYSPSDIADAGGGDRAHEGNAAEMRQRGGGGDHRQNVAAQFSPS